MTRRCHGCRDELAAADRFCGSCGRPAGPEPTAGPLPVDWLLTALLMLGAVVAVVVLSGFGVPR